jgi:NADH-quinone oxidoreductase subunit J
MTSELILFFILAIVAVASAVGMLLSRNAVYAALYLILNFATVAVFYLMLSAPFISLVQVTVYAGAIMVLFLFVIMLLGAESTGLLTESGWMFWSPILLGAVLVIEALYIVYTQWSSIPATQAAGLNFGAPAVVGLELFQKYLLPFEVTSVLLLVAMIGAILLARSRSGAQDRP